MKFPLFKIVLNDDDQGVFNYALVDQPAIIREFIAFNDQVSTFFQNDEKQILAGPLLIPDLQIYRKATAKLPEHYLVWTADVIEEVQKRFAKNKLGDQVNLMHSDLGVPGYTIESWIVQDSEHDKSSLYGGPYPVGTWFVLYQVTDSKFWKEKIKTGEIRGFSIEALTALEQINQKQMKLELKAEVGAMIPDGEYVQSDGTVIIVKDGVVAEVVGEAVEAAEEPKAEEPKAEEPKVEEPKVEEPKAEEPKADNDAVKAEMKAYIDELVNANIEAFEERLTAIEKAFAEKPEAEVKQNSEVKLSTYDRILKLKSNK